MTESEARALVAQLNEAEKRELLTFVKILLERQDRGQTITEGEAAKMEAAARERIAQAERLTA